MSNFKFFTVHESKNNYNVPSVYLQIGKHDYFSNPAKYPTDSYVLELSKLSRFDITIEELKEVEYLHI